MPTPEEIAYVAGQLDADGSICLTSGGSWLIRQVQLYSQDKEMLEWVQELFGGSIYLCGKVWSWKPKHRVAFIEVVLPYLHTKKEQAELLVESSLWQMTPELIQDYVSRSKALNGKLPLQMRRVNT